MVVFHVRDASRSKSHSKFLTRTLRNVAAIVYFCASVTSVPSALIGIPFVRLITFLSVVQMSMAMLFNFAILWLRAGSTTAIYNLSRRCVIYWCSRRDNCCTWNGDRARQDGAPRHLRRRDRHRGTGRTCHSALGVAVLVFVRYMTKAIATIDRGFMRTPYGIAVMLETGWISIHFWWFVSCT